MRVQFQLADGSQTGCTAPDVRRAPTNEPTCGRMNRFGQSGYQIARQRGAYIQGRSKASPSLNPVGVHAMIEQGLMRNQLMCITWRTRILDFAWRAFEMIAAWTWRPTTTKTWSSRSSIPSQKMQARSSLNWVSQKYPPGNKCTAR